MPRVPLVLLHHAGGTRHVFEPLIASLPDVILPVPIELPGRGKRWREPLITEHAQAVQDIARLVPRRTGRVAIFGHSLGAHLALSLAAHLESTGGPMCSMLFASANADPVTAVPPFNHNPMDATDHEIFDIARTAGGDTPNHVVENVQLKARTATTLRADFCLSATFTRQQRRAVTEAPIVVCCGTTDIFSRSQLAHWRVHSTTGCELVRFPGGHFYLIEEAPALANVITERLAGFEGENPRRSACCGL